MDQNKPRVSVGQRWSNAQPSKTVVFWACIASVVATLIVGFSWGGWVTGGTARNLAEAAARDAVLTRLAPICVVQFKADPGKDAKLADLRNESNWRRGEYVGKQGWATMPGETDPDSRVADECANLLMQIS